MPCTTLSTCLAKFEVNREKSLSDCYGVELIVGPCGTEFEIAFIDSAGRRFAANFTNSKSMAIKEFKKRVANLLA